VLALSVYSEDQYAVRALRAGAAGYVSKSSGAEELVEAIRTVASGRMFVSQALAQILANWLEDLQQVPPHETLSERERAVLCMLASGMSLSEIAGHLALSIKTVSTYKARTLKKLNAATNADLIAYAVRHQLCDR
jgi:DNA-binding NarL/FixJ family response regulator